MTGAPESATGHRWPCTGFYLTSTTKDRTTRCACGVGRPRRRTIAEIVRALEDAQDMDAVRELIPELRASVSTGVDAEPAPSEEGSVSDALTTKAVAPMNASNPPRAMQLTQDIIDGVAARTEPSQGDCGW